MQTNTLSAACSRNRHTRVKRNYYSFKIFPQLWLAKSTRINHHNQLLMTKYGRILCLSRKWHQKCSPLQVKAPLPRRTGDEVELFWLWKQNGGHYNHFKSEITTAGTRRNNSWNIAKTARRQLGRWHLLFGEYVWSWTNLNIHYRRWTYHQCR